MPISKRIFLTKTLHLMFYGGIGADWWAAWATHQPNNFGHFIGHPYGRLLNGIFELDKDFEYIDPEGIKWRVSAPFQTDGASIPWIFWPIIGHPLGGDYVSASIVHDYFCRQRFPSHQAVHQNFYNGLRAAGIAEDLARVMYIAVVTFGPRWTEPAVPKECNARDAAFDPSKCLFNDSSGISGTFVPSEALNKENIFKFLDLLQSNGLSDRAEQIKQLPEIKGIIDK
jgi:hypothetical protein